MNTENPNKPEGNQPKQEGQYESNKVTGDELEVVIDPEEEKKKGNNDKKTGTKLVDSGSSCPPVAG
jgi:hypothetical protein